LGCGSDDNPAETSHDVPSMVPLVDTATLDQMLASDDPPLLLDVRTPGEFAEGHIRGAMLMPSYSVAARLKEIEGFRHREIVIYCEVGVRSLRISKFLYKKGFTEVLHYQGGVRAWLKAEMPLIK
jgi:rhodanese-related sulfurtransferase